MMTFPSFSKSAVAVALVSALVFAAGCNDEVGGVPPNRVARDLAFKKVSSSATTAQVGDQITVSWTYNNDSLLTAQRFQVLGLTIQGISSQSQNLPGSQRSITFPFGGPVTVVITAQQGQRAIDAAFDIALDSQYGFTISGITESQPGFPRLGQRVLVSTVNGRRRTRVDPTPFDIKFSHFFSIYEVPDANGLEDGVIDGLQTPDLVRTMPPAQSFFGHSFRVEEVQNFGFRLGSGFPVLEPGYLLTNDGGQFFGQHTTADAVAFAGKIVYDGEAVRDRKTGLRYRRNVALFEPVFCTVDLRSDANGVLHVADVDLGNVNQGLVLSVFHGETPFRALGTTDIGYDVPSLGAVGELGGSIKGSSLGFGVTLRDGTILTSNLGGVEVPGVYAGVASIDWVTPFFPDTDLSGVNQPQP